MTQTGTQTAVTVVSVTYLDRFARLRERLAIQTCTDPDDPRFRLRCRQLGGQMDEYCEGGPVPAGGRHIKEPLIVVSARELSELLAHEEAYLRAEAAGRSTVEEIRWS